MLQQNTLYRTAPLSVNRTASSRGHPCAGRHGRRGLPNVENTLYYALECEVYLATTDSRSFPTPSSLHTDSSSGSSVRILRQEGRVAPRMDARPNLARTEKRGKKSRGGNPKNRTSHWQDIQAGYRQPQRNGHLQRASSHATKPRN